MNWAFSRQTPRATRSGRACRAARRCTTPARDRIARREHRDVRNLGHARLLHRVARHFTAPRIGAEHRQLAPAAIVREWTPRMERAAGRRVERIGNLARDRGAHRAGHREVRHGCEQHPRVRMPGQLEQAPCRRKFDDAAQVHHPDPVCDVVHDGEIVRDEEVREPHAPLQIAHQVQYLRLHRDVQRRSRLVAHQEARLGGERARDRDALPLSPGELVRIFATVRSGKAHLREKRGNICLDLDPRSAGREGKERLRDDVGHSPARIQARVGVLKDHLHAAPRRPLHRRRASLHAGPCDDVTVERNGPPRRRVESHHQPGDRRLPASGFAHEPERLPALDREAHPVHRLEQHTRCPLEQSVEPRRRNVERARDVDELEQRRWLVAHRRHSFTRQHAARVVRTSASSGSSLRQRSTARGHRG